jgi:hypothetical protein
MSTVVDEETGEVFDVDDGQLELFRFEGHVPDGSMHVITGSFGEGECGLPDLTIDSIVMVMATGVVKGVNHKRDKSGALIRIHTIVLDSAVQAPQYGTVSDTIVDAIADMLPASADSMTMSTADRSVTVTHDDVKRHRERKAARS